jgi:hypothetical protein
VFLGLLKKLKIFPPQGDKEQIEFQVAVRPDSMTEGGFSKAHREHRICALTGRE